MEKIYFETSIEKKSWNNFISSKIDVIHPLVYESAFYVILKNQDNIIIGISKNYIFENYEEIFIFKDNIFPDKDSLYLQNNFYKYGIQYSIWIHPDYRNNSLGKLLFNRTLAEFNKYKISYIRSPICKTSTLLLSEFYDKKFNNKKIIKEYNKNIDFILFEFKI
jgi:GNAT superfamily N-acetyltransferase